MERASEGASDGASERAMEIPQHDETTHACLCPPAPALRHLALLPRVAQWPFLAAPLYTLCPHPA
eukprot:653644-Pleurochrysis_carterae.AAC.1